jgi:hypothetical protein
MKDELTDITQKLETDDVIPVEMNQRLEELKTKQDTVIMEKDEVV